MDSRVRHGNDWKKTPPALLSLVPLPRSPASPYIHPAARISSPTTGRHRGLPLQTTRLLSLVSCHSSLVTRLSSLVSRHSSPVTRLLSLVTRLSSLVSCHSSPVTRLLSLVSCHSSLVTRLLSLVSRPSPLLIQKPVRICLLERMNLQPRCGKNLFKRKI